MAKSFRLQFVDIDSSYTINTTEAAVKGYIVCRAPKGTTEAMYFNYGNEKAINAMVGLPTADWIDLYEAVAFNKEYGLYISAPAGSGADYPSYYGGIYVTTQGPFSYWQVNDADNPNYEVSLIPGSEAGRLLGPEDAGKSSEIELVLPNCKATIGAAKNCEVTVDNKGDQALVAITGLSKLVYNRLNHITFNYWGSLQSGADTGAHTYYIDRITKHIYYEDRTEGIIKQEGENSDLYCGTIVDNGGTVTLLLGGNSATTVKSLNGKINLAGTSQNVGSPASMIPYLDLGDVVDLEGLKKLCAGPEAASVQALPSNSEATLSGLSDGSDPFNGLKSSLVSSDVTGTPALVKSLLLGWGEKPIFSANDAEFMGTVAEEFVGLNQRPALSVNIKDMTLCRINQKSPCEKATFFEIPKIGYDKYLYDQRLEWAYKDDIITEGNTLVQDNIKPLIDKRVLLFAKVSGVMAPIGIIHIEDANTWADVTSKYLTQRIYTTTKVCAKSVPTPNIADMQFNVFEVVRVSATAISKKTLTGHVFGLCEDNAKAKYPLKKDSSFDTMTISCKEEVIPGELVSGGEFTGSLNEKGTDTFGSNIYWPNVLPEETVTFISIYPVNKLDDAKLFTGDPAINTSGFFTGPAPIARAGDAPYIDSLKGTRFCTYVNNKNIEEGKLGSSWRDEYYQIIKDGIIEAQSPEYDDALVFMEPSGYEDFKQDLMSLRVKYHDTSTIISPKIITKAEFMNPKTIAVSGRSKGTAQYIGEFKKYDTFTGKYYYCQPIGDVGLQLARIMDKKLGGIAPAGTNDSAGLGGCLSRAVLAAKWSFSDEALKILDEKGLCAITYDADYGLMIQSQKSTQDPSMVTDWSYLGHSMSFDLCKREIRDKVMVQQLFKRISPYWMDIRTKQVQAILDKRTTGSDPIWATAKVDITGQNNGTTMAKRQFVIKVTCKVYVYSETVLLIFENLSQE